MNRLLRRLACAGLALKLGCGGAPGQGDGARATPGTAAAAGPLTDADVAAIYAAVLRHQGSSHGALNPLLMSDSGTFEPHGELPASVRAALLAGSVDELCVMRPGTYWPECSARVRAEVRFSWPRPAGGDTVSFFVAHGTLPPAPGDTTVYIPMGFSHRCQVVRSDRGWRVVRCVEWMVT